MSKACKCDRCGELFVPAAGMVSLDVSIATTKDPESFSSWEECEFCPTCSAMVMEVIRPALNGFDPREHS